MPQALGDILVFRSARPGASFETWLFQKLTACERRTLTAALIAYAPRWRPGEPFPGGLARRGPDLYESRIRMRAEERTLTTVGVFFVWTRSGSILLSGGVDSPSARGEIRNLGFGAAHHRLRELRAAQRDGVLCRRLGLYTFEEIKHQSRVGRLIAWDRERQPGLFAFSDVVHLVREEAEAHGGRQGLRELACEADRRILATSLLRRRCELGLTQAAVAARSGVRQATVSEIEHGLANPTLATLSALSQALGLTLDTGGRGAG